MRIRRDFEWVENYVRWTGSGSAIKCVVAQGSQLYGENLQRVGHKREFCALQFCVCTQGRSHNNKNIFNVWVYISRLCECIVFDKTGVISLFYRSEENGYVDLSFKRIFVLIEVFMLCWKYFVCEFKIIKRS